MYIINETDDTPIYRPLYNECCWERYLIIYGLTDKELKCMDIIREKKERSPSEEAFLESMLFYEYEIGL